MAPGQIRVNVFGSDYTLKSDDDENLVKEIAKFVDNKMREIDRQYSLKSSVMVAILAAMQISEELFQEREHRKKLLKQLNEESRKMNRLLIDAIEE